MGILDYDYHYGDGTDDILDRPRHPYTIGLIGSVPSNEHTGDRLYQIPGMAPSPPSSAPQAQLEQQRRPRGVPAGLDAAAFLQTYAWSQVTKKLKEVYASVL